MRSRWIGASILGLAGVGLLVVTLERYAREPNEASPAAGTPAPRIGESPRLPDPVDAEAPLDPDALAPRRAPARIEAAEAADAEANDDLPRAYDIEDLKQAIYALEIDTTDRLHLLDELVRTGDADTRTFWSDGWSGVDDWKRDENGFHLERTADGSLVFVPDLATTRTYTFMESLEPYAYDAETGEFVNEVDYYGKRIVNKLKFMDGGALVMMTISGRKVDLNIYQRKTN